MKTKEVKNLLKKLKKGDVVLVSQKGIMHSISRALQRSKWHHVMLYIGKGKTLESTPRKGTHVCDLQNDFMNKKYINYKILRNKKLNRKQRGDVVKEALRLFKGKKFSWLQYLKIAIGRLFAFKKESKSAICTPGHKCNTENVACSNMVAMAYYEAGFPISEKYKPEYVIPKDYEKSKTLKTIITGMAHTKSRTE